MRSVLERRSKRYMDMKLDNCKLEIIDQSSPMSLAMVNVDSNIASKITYRLGPLS